MTTTVLIVTHNSQGHVRQCLNRLAGEPVRILVIDNASTDRTVDEICEAGTAAKWIANPLNRGFAGAVNQGFLESDTDLVLLLNPDTEWLGGLSELECAARKHGIACGQLLGPDGKGQSGFTVRRLPTAVTLFFESLGLNRLWAGNPVNRRYRAQDLDLSKPQFVEQPAGAMLMIRRDVWESLGGFDERFHPVWFEDVDFCRRALNAGWKIYYTPAARAQHAGGHSVGTMNDSSRMQAWYGSLLRYAAKHFSGTAFRTVCASVAVGCGLRVLAAIGDAAFGIAPGGRVRVLAGLVGLAGRLCWVGPAALPLHLLGPVDTPQRRPRAALAP